MKKGFLKRIAALVLAAALSVSLAACASSSDITDDASESADDSVDAQTDDDTLVIAVSLDFTTVDTIVSYGTEQSLLISCVAERLFYFDENSEVQSFLVESWEQEDDTTYVYQIRQDVTFSDGTQLTAEDVAFSLNRHLDENNASQLAWMFEKVELIEQTGDYEVTVTLSEPDATWQYVLATPAGDIISKAYYEENSEDFGTADGGLIGSGPYVITSWDTAEMDLEYNEDYWNADETQVGFISIQFLSISDQSVVKTALESGQIDLTQNISLDTAKELEDNDSINIQATDYLGSTFLSYNTSQEPLDDAAVRQAILYGIDREAILTDIIGENYASIGKSLLFSEKIADSSADLWGDYFDNEETYSYDPEKAIALLEEAGYGDGLELTLKYTAADSTAENVALYIQANLAEIGVTIQLEGIDTSELYTLRYGGSDVRDYELLLTSWASDYPDPVGTIQPMYYSANSAAGGSNWAEYNNSEFDALIDAQGSVADAEERIALLKEALDILSEDVPYAPLYNHYKVFATSSRVDYTFSTMVMYNLFVKDIQKAE